MATVGIINISFRLGKQYRRIECRVIRNLIHDFVLGWDFFSKYGAQLHAQEGYLSCEGEKISLIENSRSLGGAQYAALEDVVIPPMSKAHFQATLLVDSSELEKATDTVCLEPFDSGDADVCTARSISKVDGGKVLVEAINPFDHPTMIPEGTVLGFAEFFTSEELDGVSEYAGMDINYDSDDSAYESMAETEAPSDNENDEALAGCSDADSSDMEAEVFASAKQGKNPLEDANVEKKAWAIDYSKMAPEAKIHEEEIRHLFEVKHADVMAKHERDYGCTNLT